MKPAKKILLICILISLFIIPQTGCGNEEPVSKTSYYLDTTCQIDIFGMEEDQASSIIDDAFMVCADYELLLSKTKEDSDIWKINHAKGKAVECDKDTIEVIEKGIYYGDLSKGKFDITIGKVTDLWDFHADEPKVPEKAKVSDCLSHVGYKMIKIDGNKVSLSDPDAQIDLGGIAKGYICDKVTAFLKDNGVESAIVNLGGNIAVIGQKNGKDDFMVGIEKPFSDRSEVVGAVAAHDKTFVTSGIYERCFEQDGKTYHHILDVKTGYPVDSNIISVSIISDLGESVNCDGLSTLCLTLGVDEATRLINSIDGVEAVFIDKDGNITSTENSGFEKK